MLRLKFSKLGKVRFTSHRDVARIWERTIRRAEVPVKYSEGYSPRPRLAFGLALSTGHESLAEYLDIELDAAPPGGGEVDVDPDAVAARLDAALPAGFAVVAASMVPRGTGSLQQIVTSTSWLIELPGVAQSVARAAVDGLLAAESVVVTRQRKGKDVEDDLRPGVLALGIVASSDDRRQQSGQPENSQPENSQWGTSDTATTLEAELGTQPRALRPAELLDALGLPDTAARVRRTHQWIHDGDARREPLPSTPSAVSSLASAGDPRRESTDVRPPGRKPPDPSAGRAESAARGADTPQPSLR